ncbi:hypothetical protein [Bacillus mesophilum]|uniref:Uncharacterized protein n=1 Tax=Bacillus mesophilum TaxID=1071718 RepID=A0A7V7RLS2_9BACI|nr:hypothetical protein [Bacillus mesophilum]KAB2331901.1 hypothetical protein F7732_14645 [Bacillus mesophilum]
MKNKWFLIPGGVIIITIVFYAYLLFNPPLDAGALSYGADNDTYLIEVGNKGFFNLKPTEVLINDKKPEKVLMQVIPNNDDEAFYITFDIENEERFKALNEAVLPAETGIQERLNSKEKDTLSYGITMLSREALNSVTIKYRYAGIILKETINY